MKLVFDYKALKQPAGLAMLTGFFILLVLTLVLGEWKRPHKILPREQVWPVVEREAARHGLDPHFVMAVLAAESGFNSRARNRRARGLMQMTPPAWQTVSDEPFRKAWNWEVNLVAGTAYLGYLKSWLEKRERFSYPLLAAAYRHGPGRLAETGFDLSRLPPTRNAIYRELDQGRIPRV